MTGGWHFCYNHFPTWDNFSNYLISLATQFQDSKPKSLRYWFKLALGLYSRGLIVASAPLDSFLLSATLFLLLTFLSSFTIFFLCDVTHIFSVFCFSFHFKFSFVFIHFVTLLECRLTLQKLSSIDVIILTAFYSMHCKFALSGWYFALLFFFNFLSLTVHLHPPSKITVLNDLPSQILKCPHDVIQVAQIWTTCCKNKYTCILLVDSLSHFCWKTLSFLLVSKYKRPFWSGSYTMFLSFWSPPAHLYVNDPKSIFWNAVAELSSSLI